MRAKYLTQSLLKCDCPVISKVLTRRDMNILPQCNINNVTFDINKSILVAAALIRDLINYI